MVSFRMGRAVLASVVMAAGFAASGMAAAGHDVAGEHGFQPCTIRCLEAHAHDGEVYVVRHAGSRAVQSL